jgi:cytochrome c peroxidase
MSCGSCHFPGGGFTDTIAVSTGIDGIAGRRSSMALVNVGYYYNGLFWDGRSATLEDQALLPVEDPIELHHQWPNVVEEFKSHATYPKMFRKAFGISNTAEITKELAAKAIAQFERTMVSSGQSKYDRQRCEPGVFFTPEEAEGFELFSNEVGNHPGCTHCHSSSNQLFTNNNYENNGIDSVGLEIDDLNNFQDWGRGEVTGNIFDNGKFRIPSLRNIMLTYPYMHDGRFKTLGEVLDHYKTGGFSAANSNSLQQPFPLTEDEKEKIIIFLETLNDPTFLNNPAFSNPFN